MTGVAPLRRAAVLGSPISHSLSPALHRAAYEQLGLPWSYEAIECDEASLPGLLDRLDENYVGLSLTMPLKRAVLPLLDDVSPLATAVGAVNTVIFQDVAGTRRRRGENTDVSGLVASVRQAHDTAVTSAAILGAGGTAAAAVAAVRELGLGRVDVVVRDTGRAVELLAAAQRLGVHIDLVDWPGSGVIEAADLLISTVPAGATDSLAATWSPRPGQLLFDVLYEPWPTRLAAAAHAAGQRVVGGLELLVQQAALQIECWSGRSAPIDAMRAAGEQVLIARAAH